jgi:hypothetical protein
MLSRFATVVIGVVLPLPLSRSGFLSMRVEKPGPSDVTNNLPTVHGSPVPEW